MLSVVGRVLVQVGCKKFATTPRFGSVKGLPLVRHLCHREASRDRTEENGLPRAVQSISSKVALRQAKCSRLVSSRLVLSRSSHQTDFRSFHPGQKAV